MVHLFPRVGAPSLDIIFLCVFGEDRTWTDGLNVDSHDYQACQAGRWVIWLVLSLLNCCQPGGNGKNKSTAASFRPSVYLLVIKISNIRGSFLLFSLVGRALNTLESHVANDQLMPQKSLRVWCVGTGRTTAGLEEVLFIHSQTFCVFYHWVKYFW